MKRFTTKTVFEYFDSFNRFVDHVKAHSFLKTNHINHARFETYDITNFYQFGVKPDEPLLQCVLADLKDNKVSNQFERIFRPEIFENDEYIVALKVNVKLSQTILGLEDDIEYMICIFKNGFVSGGLTEIVYNIKFTDLNDLKFHVDSVKKYIKARK